MNMTMDAEAPCTLAEESASRLLKMQVRAMRKHLKTARTQDLDGIHDLRVASRRLRAVLTEHAALFEKAALKRFQRRTRRLTNALGKPRELDSLLVLLEKLRDGARGTMREAILYVTGWLKAHRDAEADHVAEGVKLVESPKFDKSLMALFESLNADNACYIETAASNLDEQFRNLALRFDLWQGSHAEEALHKVRVQLKKLRYSCEIYEPLYGAEMKDFLAMLREAQEHLGNWNDCRVLRGYLQQAAEGAPEKAKKGIPKVLASLDQANGQHLEKFNAQAATLFAPDRVADFLASFKSIKRVCCRKSAKEDTPAEG
ncbi:MAG: CHAD domain-containing protein [Candidatus Hydrogenedentes bacterium]|nr:CHAD domain-containing protein [Candidatus Hydrogenedentota bacterium]